jgi:hypothetical protein
MHLVNVAQDYMAHLPPTRLKRVLIGSNVERIIIMIMFWINDAERFIVGTESFTRRTD